MQRCLTNKKVIYFYRRWFPSDFETPCKEDHTQHQNAKKTEEKL
jgi:hypothetical protein